MTIDGIVGVIFWQGSIAPGGRGSHQNIENNPMQSSQRLPRPTVLGRRASLSQRASSSISVVSTEIETLQPLDNPFGTRLSPMS
ncbi:hypothetical protein ABIB82_005416 [Bradyrhizobium sp. i1.8.4]